MKPLLSRGMLTLSGGFAGALVVALLEGFSVIRPLHESGSPPPTGVAVGFILADAGVLAPVGLLIGALVLVLGLVVSPGQTPSAFERIAVIRAHPTRRLRAAALGPAVVLALFAAMVGAAHAARRCLALEAPALSGLTTAVATVGLSIVSAAAALALLPSLWRALARNAESRLADPIVTGGLALAVAIALVTLGIVTGDTGGAGGLAGVGIFAVLARPELDLRPIVYILVVSALAYLGGTLHRRPWRGYVAAVGVALAGASLALTVRSARSLNEAPAVVDLLGRSALGKLSLGVLRRVTDRDHDGYSPLFGGGDCDDRDPGVNPAAIDIPGNGVDEDCTGQDTPPSEPDSPAPTPEPSNAPDEQRRPLNVVLITVDTLRHDLGFTGYPRPVTPNLDKLAERSIVFERAYSMASYTAKSMGALMMGKYSSEAARNWDHYTAYFPQNTFLAERAHALGVHTFAGHCHYYFAWNTGYSRGFDVYDTSAIAPSMADNDSSVTSDRLSDLAIRLLSRPANVQPSGGRRFFAWFHYFDPHSQYVHHPGAPDFGKMPGGPPGRAIYDDEVWFTDKHLGRVIDFISSAPWGAETAIIVTADHGEAFGDAHGVKTHGHELWEPLVRIPLVIHIPGERARRITVKRSAIDVAPTILDLLGLRPPPPGELRGTSLLGDLRGDGPPAERDVYLDMPEGPYNGVRRALLTGPTPGLKLVHLGAANYELYDLAKDPHENEDLAKDPDRLRPVVERMDRFRSRLKEVAVVGAKVAR